MTPLREGGSLPAIIEADDDGLYVVKFRGAGQGSKALIAELLAGEIGRLLGLPVPEIVFVDLPAELARTEPDAEIQGLISASAGLNIGLDYLPGSVSFDPLVFTPDSQLASAIVWFDAFVCNVDRTVRNVNMLIWHRKLWLIDHGASLYFHHSRDGFLERATQPFALIKDHVLLPFASRIAEVDAMLASRLTCPVLENIAARIPEAWLGNMQKSDYVEYLARRLQAPRAFVEEAIRARTGNL